MTTATNEAAERFRLGRLIAQEGVLEAFAAERRATVERIRNTVLLQRNRLGMPREALRVTELLALLDEEAAR